MDWFRSFATDAQLPEMQALSHAAFRLWHDGRCYIAQTESDGFIPSTQISRFGPHGTPANAKALVAAGLWETAPTGYIDVRWEQEQKSHAAMESSRKATAERVRRHRNGVGNGVTNGVGNTTRGREEQELKREVEVQLHQTWPRAVNE